MVKRISRDASDVEFWVRFLVGALERVGEHGTMAPRGYGLVVERVLAKDETGVRFSLSAQKDVSWLLLVPNTHQTPGDLYAGPVCVESG